MHRRVAVALSGCGVYDDAETHKSVITLPRLSQRGTEAQCFAPNIVQHHVANHLTGEETPESRNVLVGSTRITRGEVKDLRKARAEDYDALIVPGGFGAAKNLSDFAINGAQYQVQPNMLALAKVFTEAGKPVGLVCVAPAMAAKIYGTGVRYTIGSDADTVDSLRQMGTERIDAPVDEIIEDSAHKLVTTPVYMLTQSIAEAASRINKLADRVLELMDQDKAWSAKREGGRVAALFKSVPLRRRTSRGHRIETPQ